MINTSTSLWLGTVFVLVGALNVWLILQSTARVRDAKASARLIVYHRVGGYLFIALFGVMGYFMVSRLGDIGAGASSGTMIHLTLAMILTPLLFVKVLVARYYKNYYSFLLPIGLAIFVLAFVLIGITAGPYLGHQARMQTVSLPAIDLPPTSIDINLAAQTMEKRCSKCHNLDRVAGARKDAQGWLTTVERMRLLPDSGISETDARTIVSYLASQLAPKGTADSAGLEVGRALVDQRCGRCHPLDRVYKTAETHQEWGDTVARMASYAAGSAGALQPGEDQKIIDYLSATQTPEAVNLRKDRAAAASSAGQSPVAQKAATLPPILRGAYDWKMTGFLSLMCVGIVTLIVRRPGAAKTAASAPVTASPSAGPLVLRLASITPQTPDSKTLRFVVANGGTLGARPGQFLTFSFLFDGKKVTRSYSICSSPVRSGYVEITPKRVSQGLVSVYLNDRASVGLTVEAKGPFGKFWFDEDLHQNVVLMAAGSGITPMMAMLRYIEDLCLDTTVTLLYAVRTESDIIFRKELDELQSRLENFRYEVLLSRPHEGWTGASGRVSREFVEAAIKEPAAAHFFLCGPPEFMAASRSILIGLAVKLERIHQESFGSAGNTRGVAGPKAQLETTGSIEFVRSRKSCEVQRGQSVLEAAEEQGVTIPFSCRQGQCGTCKTRLLEGKVSMDAEEGLDPESRAQGFVLTCVGHPQGVVKLDA